MNKEHFKPINLKGGIILTGKLIIIFAIIFIVIVVMCRVLNKAKFLSRSFLIIELFSMITSVSLGVNYLGALSGKEDGITINNGIAWWFFGDDGWSIELFKSCFESSLSLSLLLLLAYVITSFVEDFIIKRKKVA